jgi:hypothetical protein
METKWVHIKKEIYYYRHLKTVSDYIEDGEFTIQSTLIISEGTKYIYMNIYTTFGFSPKVRLLIFTAHNNFLSKFFNYESFEDIRTAINDITILRKAERERFIELCSRTTEEEYSDMMKGERRKWEITFGM